MLVKSEGVANSYTKYIHLSTRSIPWMAVGFGKCFLFRGRCTIISWDLVLFNFNIYFDPNFYKACFSKHCFVTAEFKIFILPADCGVLTHPHFYTDLRPWPNWCITRLLSQQSFLAGIIWCICNLRPTVYGDYTFWIYQDSSFVKPPVLELTGFQVLLDMTFCYLLLETTNDPFV